MLTALCIISGMKGIICAAVASVVIQEELLGLSFGVMCAISDAFRSLSPVAVSVVAGRISGNTAFGQALAIVCIVTSTR